jgi:hypothetical protein
VTHPGIVKGVFDVRNIRDTTQVYSRDYVAAVGPVVSVSKVRLAAVRFDANVRIAGVVRGGVNGDVPTGDQIGFVQLEPSGSPLTPAQYADLLADQGPLGGPIDCLIDVGGSGQQMRLTRVDVAAAVTAGGQFQFAAAGRGSPKLPKDGQWSMVRKPTNNNLEAQALDRNFGIPLVRQGVAGLDDASNGNPYLFADPGDVLTPDRAQTDYGWFWSTGTHRILFPRPKIAIGAHSLTSDLAPLLADSFAMGNASGIFPPANACINVPSASYALQIQGGAGLRLADVPPTLEVVVPNAAVCYQEVPDGRPIWVVLEDTKQPNADFEEIELDSDRARALLGKRVGETAVLAQGTMQNRLAKILQVMPKYVRRFQDSMEQLPIRFGPASGVEAVRIAPTADDPAGLKPILSSIQQRAGAVDRVNQLYKDQPASLHLLGSLFGHNAYVALMELVRRPDIGIKCCQGTAGERAGALLSLQTARVVVVDLTALCTLRLLGLVDILKSVKYEFVVAERTIVELNQMLAESGSKTGDGLSIEFREGKHVGYKTTAQTKKELQKRDEEFIRFIEASVTVENAPAVAALEPDKRKTFFDAFGAYGTESILLAGMPDRTLWTDDLIQAQFAAQELGVNRVWTQLMLETMASDGVLLADKYADATASLIGMNFLSTMFNADSISAGFRLASWSLENFPMSQFRKVLSEVPDEVFIRLFLEVTRDIYRDSLPPETRCAVTSCLLELFAGRPNADARFSALRKLVSSIFGLNLVGASQFQACFDRWLNQRRDPIIVVAK